MSETPKPSGLFSIEEVDSASAGYPLEPEGCDLCEHCRLRRTWPPANQNLSTMEKPSTGRTR